MKKLHLLVLLLALLLLAGCGRSAESGAEAVEALDYAVEKAEAHSEFLSNLGEGRIVSLLCGAPAVGEVRKTLFFTQDGGESWSGGIDVSEGIENYPVGAVFLSEEKGFVLTDYHGSDNHLFATADGGQSWESITLPFSAASFRYVEGREIRYESGTIYLSLVGRTADGITYLRYRSDDDGQSWRDY